MIDFGGGQMERIFCTFSVNLEMCASDGVCVCVVMRWLGFTDEFVINLAYPDTHYANYPRAI